MCDVPMCDACKARKAGKTKKQIARDQKAWTAKQMKDHGWLSHAVLTSDVHSHGFKESFGVRDVMIRIEDCPDEDLNVGSQILRHVAQHLKVGTYADRNIRESLYHGVPRCVVFHHSDGMCYHYIAVAGGESGRVVTRYKLDFVCTKKDLDTDEVVDELAA